MALNVRLDWPLLQVSTEKVGNVVGGQIRRRYGRRGTRGVGVTARCPTEVLPIGRHMFRDAADFRVAQVQNARKCHATHFGSSGLPVAAEWAMASVLGVCVFCCPIPICGEPNAWSCEGAVCGKKSHAMVLCHNGLLADTGPRGLVWRAHRLSRRCQRLKSAPNPPCRLAADRTNHIPLPDLVPSNATREVTNP